MNTPKLTCKQHVRNGCVIAVCFFLLAYPCVLRAQALDSAQSSSTSMTGGDLTSKCLACHQYWEQHHPIGIVPSHPSHYAFPLYEGKIMCLTCHVKDHLEGDANLLREGPYVDRREICFKCHAEGEYAKINPHTMLDGRGNVLLLNGQPVCLFCHSAEPALSADRAEDVLLKADVAFLCLRCHPPMANQKFFEEHFLVTPSMEMRRFMEKQEQRLHATLPLVPRDRITCSTCHDPHQKGVIIFAYSASGADAPHRLRLPAAKICIACHNIM